MKELKTKQFDHFTKVAENVLKAFGGNHSEYDSDNGFRVVKGGKQTIAFYWRSNDGDNWAELAIDPRALSPSIGQPSTSRLLWNWMNYRAELTGRACKKHKADSDWPIVGFGDAKELDDFLTSYKSLLWKPDDAVPVGWKPKTTPNVPLQPHSGEDSEIVVVTNSAGSQESLRESLLALYLERIAVEAIATEIEVVRHQRIGQEVLRPVVLERWGNRCAVTGIHHVDLLITSHIKRWCDSTNSERLDPDNAIPLAAHIDKAFDAGLMSFKDDGQMIVSSTLSLSDRNALGITAATAGLREEPNLKQRAYLAWHRANRLKA